MDKPIIHTSFDQYSDEYWKLRAGRMTASNASTVMANGVGLKTYIYQILADLYSSAEPDSYTNEDMLRGRSLEPQARSLYELETNNIVTEVGFVSLGEYVGASPDGTIDEDGLIEIKSHNDAKHLRLLIEGRKAIEKKYIDQMQMQMYITGRKWVDYVAFAPSMKHDLLIFRVERDEVAFEKLEKGIAKGIELIQQIEEKYEKNAILHSRRK